jgi:hypothetical protein
VTAELMLIHVLPLTRTRKERQLPNCRRQ